jgi:hypothetical protein
MISLPWATPATANSPPTLILPDPKVLPTLTKGN